MDPWAPTDPLGEALHLVRMNGAFYCRSELSAPWGLTLPAMPQYLWFHVVTLRRRAGSRPARTTPPGCGRAISRSSPTARGTACSASRASPLPASSSSPREAVSDRYEILRHGGGGAPTSLICGAVRFDHPAARSLVEILPQIVHVQAGVVPLGLDAEHAAVAWRSRRASCGPAARR